MKKYLYEVLLIQILATYLVIIGHSYPLTITIPQWLNHTRTFIYSFHMPLFVWISGYLLIFTQQTTHNDLDIFIKKRFLKLLVPYIILSLIAIIPKYAVQPYLNDSLTLDVITLIRTFFVPRENIWGHFWFLPMIFTLGITGFIFDTLLIKNGHRKIGWTLMTIILFVAYVCFYKQNISQWISLNDLISFGWIFALGALSACCSILTRLTRNSLIYSISCITISSVIFIYTPPSIAPLLRSKRPLSLC